MCWADVIFTCAEPQSFSQPKYTASFNYSNHSVFPRFYLHKKKTLKSKLSAISISWSEEPSLCLKCPAPAMPPKLFSLTSAQAASPKAPAINLLRCYSTSIIPAAPSALQRGQVPTKAISYPSIPRRSLARLRPDRETSPELWFTSTRPALVSRSDARGHNETAGDHKPVDERIIKLGKSELLRLVSCQHG